MPTDSQHTPLPLPDSNYVLDEAERLFLEQGYAGTKLRELASRLKIKPASLYYHAPGGKEELWQMVIDRVLKRHRSQLVSLAQQADPAFRSQLTTMADWLVSQPPVNMLSLITSQLQTSQSQTSVQLSERIYQAMMEPFVQVLQSAIERGEIRPVATDLVAGALIVSINGLLPLAHTGQLPRPARELAHELIDIFLDGLRRQ